MIDQLPIPRSFYENTKAASELIGYIIVFSIIISTVVVVSLSATPIIEESQSSESARAMEYSFLTVDESVTTVQDGATNQLLEVEVPAGQLRQLDATTIQFEQSTVSKSMTIETRPMEYTARQGHTVVYNARFIAASPNGDAGPNTQIRHLPVESHMQKNPIVRIPELTRPSGLSAYFSSRATVVPFEINRTERNQQANSEIFYESDGLVTVTVDTEIPSAWEAYMDESNTFSSVSRTGPNQVSANVDFSRFDGDRFTVTSHVIETVFGQ